MEVLSCLPKHAEQHRRRAITFTICHSFTRLMLVSVRGFPVFHHVLDCVFPMSFLSCYP